MGAVDWGPDRDRAGEEDRGCERLASGPIPRDTRCNIEANQLVDDASLLHLRDLLALESLGLNTTRVTDAGIPALKGLPNLRELALANTEITDAGLAYIKAMGKLESLSIGDNENHRSRGG